MKNIIVILMTAIIMLACNNKKAVIEKEAVSEPVHMHEEADVQDQKGEVNGLKLNNGSKWKSDSSTNKNVGELRTMAVRFRGEQHKTLNEYIVFSAELQNVLDRMIKECKMTGADHDALHHWLEPVLKDVKSLNTAETLDNATHYFEGINRQLNLFSEYFS